MQLNFIHITSLIIAMLAALWLSINAGKKIKSADDYSVGGRSAGSGMVAGALLGTVVGGAATVGTAQMGFTAGLVACWFTLGTTAGMLVLGLFYAAKLRRYHISTVPEFLVLSYEKYAAPLSSVISTAGMFFSLVTSFITAAGLVTLLFNISTPSAMLFSILASAGLVYFGGIGGSGLAGLFKMLLLTISMFTGAYVVLANLGGLGALTQHFTPAQLNFDFYGNLPTLGGMVVGIVVTQTYVQALFSARTATVATVGACMAGVACAPIGFAAALIGMSMKLQHPEIQPINALPLFLMQYLPAWLSGVGFAALLLSVFGSIAGLALGMSTMIAQDICVPLLKIKDSSSSLRINRFLMLAFMIFSAIFSYFQLGTMVLFWNYLSMGLRGAGIFIPFTLAVFFPTQIRSNFGLAAMFIGTIIYFISDYIFPWDNNILSAVLVTTVICLVGWRKTTT